MSTPARRLLARVGQLACVCFVGDFLALPFAGALVGLRFDDGLLTLPVKVLVVVVLAGRLLAGFSAFVLCSRSRPHQKDQSRSGGYDMTLSIAEVRQTLLQ